MNYFLVFLIICALIFGARKIVRNQNDSLEYLKNDYREFSKMATNEKTKEIFKNLSK